MKTARSNLDSFRKNSLREITLVRTSNVIYHVSSVRVSPVLILLHEIHYICPSHENVSRQRIKL